MFILGEPFNTEEINEMLQTCLAFADPESQAEEPHILYKYYINELVIDDDKNWTERSSYVYFIVEL